MLLRHSRSYLTTPYLHSAYLSFLVCFLLGTLASAQITPSADAYTNTATPTVNFGAKTVLDVQSATQTTYIQFDLSSIPSGYGSDNLAKASLKLYVNAVATAGSFNVDYVNGAWAENTITANLAPALGTTIVASVPLTKSQAHDYIVIDITAAVGAWLDGGQANEGIALVGNSPLNASFDSKESTTQSHPPEIDIVFSGSGGGGTITGVLTGAGSGLTGGGTSGTLNLSLVANCASGQVLAWNGSAWACTNMGGGGSGTVTSVGLTAPSTDFIVTGSPVTTSGTLGLGWLVAPDPNNTANAIVKRDSSGNFSAGTINAAMGFNLGGAAFAFGSYANENAFLGFAGNTATTGYQNTATGVLALLKNSTGGDNTASGFQALGSNTTGGGNTASGADALQTNTTGNNNTATGNAALPSNTTGSDNTAMGYQALWANTASQNAAFGSGALYSNTTGQQNTASGYQALYKNTGSWNTASGFQALFQNTTGNYNTASGLYALTANTTGIDNTATGTAALQNNSTGSYNTGSGYFSLFHNTTGSSNTALGVGADVGSGNLTNATAIGANAVVSQSNALVLGGTGANAVNVGIGTATPGYALDVQGTGNFTGPVKFAGGQQFPGTGTITGITAGTDLLGGGTSGTVTLNVDTTKVVTGVAAGTDLTGGGTGGVQTLNLDTTKVPQLNVANTFTGNQTVNGNLSATGVVTGNSFNIGSNLFAWGSYANGNAFLGFAGNTKTTGNWNTASGVDALSGNTTGGENTASGWAALSSNTTGSGNTASGHLALSNTNANNNTGVGAFALNNSKTGDDNTALGIQAGPDVNSPALYNSTAIGAHATVSQSNALVLGCINALNGCKGNVNVGIGTATPQQRLDINNGDVILRGLNNFGANGDVANLYVGDTAHVIQGVWGKGIYIGTPNQPQAVFVEDWTGNVTIKGNLSKGGGSFKIDHPLDPANKYLYHSFVESPDMMNVYNGNVVTNNHGLATVVLPDYFEALNRDFRYQLTVIGQFAQAMVASEISDNHFTIRTNRPGVKVSWQVTGIRHDAYADAHRIQVEEEKKPEERGHYLHPELFGAPEQQAIGAHSPKPTTAAAMQHPTNETR